MCIAMQCNANLVCRIFLDGVWDLLRFGVLGAGIREMDGWMEGSRMEESQSECRSVGRQLEFIG